MAALQLKKQYKKYPSYKDSGVDWLGKIPCDWLTEKLKANFKLSNERLFNDRTVDSLLSVSGYRGIEKKNIDSMDGQMPSEDVSLYRIVRKGQLVVNTMWLNYTGLGVSDFEGYVSPAYRAYNISISMHPKYVHYLLRSHAYVQKYSSLLYGIRPNSLQVKPYDFEKIEVLKPTIDEQKKIADFLDEKIGMIDKIIDKKKRQIELLQERRTAIINKAITRGLDPKAEIVDSGIEWIGKIPKKSRIEKIKFGISYISRGISPDYVDEGIIQIINQACIGWDGIDLKKAKYQKDLIIRDSTYLKKGDILMNSTGTGTLGRVNIFNLEGKFLADSHVTIIRTNYKLHSGYLKLILESGIYQGYIYSTCVSGSTNQIELSRERLKNIPVVLPDIEVQEHIFDKINKEIDLIIKTKQSIENSLAFLQEFKGSLISNVVTGKVMV